MGEYIYFDTHPYLWMYNRIYINSTENLLNKCHCLIVKYKRRSDLIGKIAVKVHLGTWDVSHPAIRGQYGITP